MYQNPTEQDNVNLYFKK